MSKLKWGLIGGGAGSQIGPVHRIAAAIDGEFELTAGALDIDANAGRCYAETLGIAAERAYGDWREMLEAERGRADRLDLVTVATPNSTHYEISRAFLTEGFNVLCEKPMTMTVEEGEEIVRVARESRAICAVNYGYSGYPLVRQMRAMVSRGELGCIRLVFAEFAHGHHGDGADADNDRVRWRYDPAQAGASAVLADCGIHALHLACYVTAQQVETVSADFASCVEGRALEDDAMINFRMSKGTVGRLWTSAVAIGRQHGLTLQVFGDRGGLRWAQEQPNQLYWTRLGEHTQIVERGISGLSADADRANRVSVGHAEGMPLAFANIYTDLAAAIRAPIQEKQCGSDGVCIPDATDGLHSVAAVHAAVESAHQQGKWISLAPLRQPAD